MQRERTFARQGKGLGVIPADAELTVRPRRSPWHDMSEELKPVLAQEMEVYAGFLEHTDHHVGRLIDAIDDLGALDDTIIYYIVGDNGARRGHTERRLQRDGQLQRDGRTGDAGVPAQQDERVGHAELLQPLRGGLGMGDGHALPVDQTGGLTLGGTRNGTIVHWPKGIEEPGGLRSQFTHVIDVAPPSWRPRACPSRPW